MKCRDCKFLEEAKVFSDRIVYRCQEGHYDRENGIPTYYALSGITRPNKAVQVIETACSHTRNSSIV